MNHCIRIYQLDLEVNAFATLQMDGHSPSLKGIKLPAALATPSTHMSTVVITKYSSVGIPRLVCATELRGVFDSEWKETWCSSVKIRCRMCAPLHLLPEWKQHRPGPSIVWHLKLLTVRFPRQGKSGDRLLARWHKIKIQILLEKLMRCSKTNPSLYIMSVRVPSNDREK